MAAMGIGFTCALIFLVAVCLCIRRMRAGAGGQGQPGSARKISAHKSNSKSKTKTKAKANGDDDTNQVKLIAAQGFPTSLGLVQLDGGPDGEDSLTFGNTVFHEPLPLPPVSFGPLEEDAHGTAPLPAQRVTYAYDYANWAHAGTQMTAPVPVPMWRQSQAGATYTWPNMSASACASVPIQGQNLVLVRGPGPGVNGFARVDGMPGNCIAQNGPIMQPAQEQQQQQQPMAMNASFAAPARPGDLQLTNATAQMAPGDRYQNNVAHRSILRNHLSNASRDRNSLEMTDMHTNQVQTGGAATRVRPGTCCSYPSSHSQNTLVREKIQKISIV